MSGYSDRKRFEPCSQSSDALYNQQRSDYVMNPVASLPPGQSKASFLGVGVTPSFYGPLSGSLVTKDSAITGRMQALDRCPESGVRYLPPSLFSTQQPAVSQCQNTTLQLVGTRLKKSCDSISEQDISRFTLQVPGAFQPGYQGVMSVVGGTIQAGIRMEPPQKGTWSGSCRKNYGSYASSVNMAPYA